MLTVAVTGASGFIGKNLVEHLQKSNDLHVIPLNLPYKNKALLAANPDAIIHLAAINRGDNDALMFEANVVLTMDLIRWCLHSKKRISVAGSSYTHGMFGATKGICESAIIDLSPNYLDATYVKLPHVFGPHCKPNYNSFVTTIMHSLAHNIEYEHKIKDRHEELDLIHVDDVCKIFERMARTPIHDLIEEEANRGMRPLPPVCHVWHDGQFRMNIKDFIAIAKGQKTRHSDIICDKIRSTMKWYHDQAH